MEPGALIGDDQVQLAGLLRERHRRLAFDRLLGYTTWTFPGYMIGPPHVRIAAALEQVKDGKIDRLMIFAPPRHGKSTLGSVHFPAWYLGHFPKREIIACSWGGELVAGFGSRLRNQMGSPEHREVFGKDSALAPDAKARDLWRTNAGGVYRAAGIGGGITGFGAHLLIIDDPVKSRQEADSLVMREAAWQWYQTDAYTRLMKGGAIVVIMTRWHHDDLAGRILEHAPEGEWTVLRMPAIDDQGRALWETEFDTRYLERVRRTMTVRQWQSLYQGEPMPASGDFFQEEWFLPSQRVWTPMQAAEGRVRIYAASDIAVTEDAGDWTVHVIVGLDHENRVHVIDMWRGRVTADRWIHEMIVLANRWKPLMWAFGRGGLHKAVNPLIMKMQHESKTWFATMTIPETTSKEVRAQAFQGMMASGMVYWHAHMPWYPTAKSELLHFPTGVHDDIVDSLSLIGRMIHGMTQGRTADPVAPPPPAHVISAEANLPDGTRPITMRELINRSFRILNRNRDGL